MGAVADDTAPIKDGLTRTEYLKGLVEVALPEKYIGLDNRLNQAFAYHLVHYGTPKTTPPAAGGALQRYIQVHVDELSEEAYNWLCEELESLKRLREAGEAGLEAISLQTGKAHRNLVAGLKSLKPEMTKQATFHLSGKNSQQLVAA